MKAWWAALAALAGAEAATTQFKPPAFNGRVGSETPTPDGSLQFLYTLQQAECVQGVFADASSEDRLGGMVLDKTAPVLSKCPAVEFGGRTYEAAYNGVQFTGTRGGAKDEFVESVGNISALELTNEFSIEMWVQTGTLGTANENLVLFEIGDETLPVDGDWGCTASRSDFDAQLSYNPQDEVFRLTYRRSGTSCTGPDFEQTTLSSDSVYHVVLTLATGNAASVYVTPFTASSPGPAVTDASTTPNLSTWTSANKLRIGSSPAVLSSNVAQALTYAWRGSILSVAMYNKALSDLEVSQNFAAGLANSAPVLPSATMVTTSGKEDSRELLDLAEVVPYDFDAQVLGVPASFSYSLAGNVTSGSSAAVVGSLFNDTALVPVAVDGDFSVGALQFSPAIANAYGFVARFPISVRDQFDAESPATGTVLIGVAAQNDAPEFTSETTAVLEVPQTQSQKILLEAEERQDCAKAQDAAAQANVPVTTSSCVQFGLSKFTIVAPPRFGKLYRPLTGSECTGLDDDSVIPSYPFDLPVVGTTIGKKSVFVCYEGCFEGSPNNLCPAANSTVQGVVGTERLNFTVTDAAGATDSHFLDVTVQSLLRAFLVPLDQVAVQEDSGFTNLTLRAVDFLCELKDGSPLTGRNETLCENRTKTFVLEALPPAFQGTLYEGPSLETAINASMLPLTLKSEVVYFKPAPDYFSRDSWPLCGTSVGTSFTQCVRTSDSALNVDRFKCSGPADMPNGCGTGFPLNRYERHTVTDLEGKLMGGCDATAAEGCPVQISYSVLVDGQQSPTAVGQKIWVTNVHDTAELVLPALEFTDLKLLTDTPILKDGKGVFIDTKGEGDTRVLQLKLDLVQNRGSLRFTSAGLDPTRIFVFEEKAARLDSGSTSFEFIGTATALNALLLQLNWVATQQATEERLKFTFHDVSTTRAQEDNQGFVVTDAEKQIKLALTPVVEEERSLNTTRIAVWSSVAASALLICGACYCCIHAILRAALRGERAAVWFVRNVLMTHIDPHDEHALDHELGVEGAAKNFEDAIHQEKVRMDRVRLCAHLFHAVCPCICKFDPSKEGELPSEEDLAKAALGKLTDRVASQHLPPLDDGGRARSLRLEVAEDEIFDWEVHEHIDEKTGQVLKYYYNPRTDQSSWEKPTVRVRRRE